MREAGRKNLVRMKNVEVLRVPERGEGAHTGACADFRAGQAEPYRIISTLFLPFFLARYSAVSAFESNASMVSACPG